MSTLRLSLIALLMVSCMQPSVLKAQAGNDSLTRVKAVLALKPQAIEAGTQKVHLSGVVLDCTARRDEFLLHDGEASISVMMSGSAVAPESGTAVELEGTVFSEPFFERKRTRIRLEKLTEQGTKPLPEGLPASVQEAADFKQPDQWITVEGTVMQVRSSMTLFTIQIVSRAASCNVLVRDWPRNAIPRDWIGGRVRVTGVNRAYLPGSNFYTLIAPSPAQVTTLKPGVVDPLDAPAATVKALRESGPSASRAKLTGTLLGATQGNVFYARCKDGGAFSFYLLHPIDEDKTGKFSTPIIVPKLVPGNVLEVVGLPGKTDPGVHLDFAVVKVLEDGKPPVPTATDLATVIQGNLVHDLVEVQGKLISLDDVLVAPGKWRTTMRLEDGEHRIIAFLDAPSRGVLSRLEVDHLLKVRGIVTGPPHFPEIRLWARSPQDVESQGMAQEVETRKLWTWLGISVAVAVGLAGWALLLRRSRAAVREQNSTLEARVAERTSELAAAKDDLARALSQERELNELKTRFVSMVSHEFRTPLGVTMSAVEVLRHFGKQITQEKHEELYQDIHSATVQMSGLMEQVLLLGKAEAGKLLWRPALLDLPDLCTKLTDETLSATNQRCPVAFTTDGEFRGAKMDSALLRHIISNLLSNAVKYSPEGSPVEFRLKREQDQVEMTFVDHGIGIPEADQSRLFEAFHRASNVGDTPGTGLGLLLVKRCAELHHGSVHLESQTGVGTTFTVRLPISKD